MSDDSASEAYARPWERHEGAHWKQLLDVQRAYRWNLRRFRLDRTLDVRCGLGHNLPTLDPGSLGVDHDLSSIATARSRGLDVVADRKPPW